MNWNGVNCFREIQVKGTSKNFYTPTFDCIPTILQSLIEVAFLFAGIVSVYFVIVGGFKIILSGGDPKKLETGRKTITYALIGLILIVTSFAILSIISNFTGVSCILKFGFTACN